MGKMRFAASMASTLLLATPAFAIDGEILVSQALVNAGGITPGDAPGFPATFSQRGRYKLTSNLFAPAGVNGIEVAQHDVTIDLNGFTLGSVANRGANRGVNAPGVGGLTVMNGTVAAYADAGVFNDGLFAVMDNLRVINNGLGLFLGNEARVRKSTITRNSFIGVQCGTRCLIQDNMITTTNPGSGVALREGGAVIGNTIMLNKSFGIFAYAAPVGFGNNSLANNNGSGDQVNSGVLPLHPNVCVPTC